LRSGKRVAMVAALLACGAILIHGQLDPWIQHIPTGLRIEALFRTVQMPGGPVAILRPPSEARPALTGLIGNDPRDAALYRLRAQEAEVALDFAAAEADWKTYAQTAQDRYVAQLELADFYHRRARPRDELAALMGATSTKDDPLLPAESQPAWRAFVRMASVTSQEDLPNAASDPVFRAWVGRYPKQRAAWLALIDHLTAHREFAAAEIEIAAFGRTFHDALEPVRMRAALAERRGNVTEAIGIYDRAFQPLWPDDMRASYFKLLEQEGQLREFAGRARTALASNPADLNATARLFHYFRSRNNLPAARRALLEYRIAKESGQQPWTADELETAARLFEWLPDVNEAARLYYALYSVPRANGAQAERALYGLANLLLTSPDQPIQFGSGDLSLYRDIAALDSSPGFLNGILSLLFNSTGPRWQYEQQNEKSAAYFHRAAATRLVTLLEQRFPRSQYREPLRAALVSAYGSYGDDSNVISAGRAYLATFPQGGARVTVAMQVADALARANRTAGEFALYDQMLRELARNAAGVPIGSNPSAIAVPASENPVPDNPDNPDNPVSTTPPVDALSSVTASVRAKEAQAATGPRSSEYVLVLDKYLSRLTALNRPLDALRVYRGELDRNPNDPGLYERLGAFLEQHGMARDVEDIYNRAIVKFADRSWYDKLARWYLRRKQSAALEKITRDAIAVFTGSELERYFSEVVSATHPDAALYRQLNLYAHDRFPEDLAFVHNLLDAYARRETRDASASDRLLRQYWFYDPQVRSQFFEGLSARRRLSSELTQVRAANPGLTDGHLDQALAANPAAVQFFMEAEAWLSHFEASAPAARALATAYPGRRDFAAKGSALYRSLAAFDKRDTQVAVTLAGFEQRADPRDQNILARMGDIYADRELFSRARAFWERMPSAQPGNKEAYLDAATVYWDYYRYDDALRWIAAARKKFDDPALFAYEAGAIYEGKRDDAAAVREYVGGALDGETQAQSRLIHLLDRPGDRDLVDRATSNALGADPAPEAVSLRIAILQAENRRQDLEALLSARVEAEKSSAELTKLQETARSLGFENIEQRASERLSESSNDPVDKMRLTIETARLLESKKDIAGGARIVDALYRDHPVILGVIRAAVDYHVRNHQADPAIDILLDASRRARSDLAAQFTLEAARDATGAGEIDRARALLSTLLTADPLRAEYLAAMSDTYLAAKDDAGFRSYQLATIQRLKQSGLATGQRIERIAAIRRSLIPALDRSHDYAGAVDQYIEVINGYPEDEALTKEAATYAIAHTQTARLIAFYRKTIADAPRDYRWPIVIARVETVAEDFPAAIADYDRAIQARPDRADVLQAKAGLEERLMRFDDAVKSYGRLYELAYRDPQWLIKVAELRARTGQTSAAVDALKTAVIGARSETADADFSIAESLENWHILPDAVAFAERGANLAGANLFAADNRNAATYSRIMARARRINDVLSKLNAQSTAIQTVANSAGPIVARLYTPGEKSQLAQVLDVRAAQAGRVARDAVLLPLAQSAGLADVEARWRFDTMSALHDQIDNRFSTLESERGVYGELGRELEDYASNNPGRPVESSALTQAAQSFIAEGDITAQTRVFGKMLARHDLTGPLLDRYLNSLAAAHADQFLAIASSDPSAEIRNRAVQLAIAGNMPSLAFSAIQTRGRTLPPVWSKAYSALAGVYFNDRSPAVDTAFQSALDTRTIGERLRNPLKQDSAIAGTVWFYYGARYGEYLVAGKNAAAEGWLPASLEESPGDPNAYVALGDLYAGEGQPAKAITELEHALDLDADRGDADDRIADVLWDQGQKPQAIARWKAALAVFFNIQSRGVRVPEPFWGRVSEAFADIGQHRALGELRTDIGNLLRDYYQRNGTYRLDELIEAAIRASIAAGDEPDWVLDLGESNDDEQLILDSVIRMPGLTELQRISLQRRLVATVTRNAAAQFGDARESAMNGAIDARLRLVSMLLDTGDVRSASVEFSQIPPAANGRFQSNTRTLVEIRLASRTGSLPALLQRYRTQPDSAPSANTLRDAALELRRLNDETGTRSVLEFMYDREINMNHLDASNFLGLVEAKLQHNDAVAAVALLNRMTLVSDDGFETLMPAASLLTRYGKTTESAVFLRGRMRAVPWDSDAQLELAQTLPQGSAERDRLLDAIVANAQANYRTRADAARMAAPRVLGPANTELALLGSTVVAPDAAARPYQVESRIDAARAITDASAALSLWRQALAISPMDARARLGALRSAIALRRDSLALALEKAAPHPQFTYVTDAPPFQFAQRRVFQYEPPESTSFLPQMQLTDAERASIAESLAAAAERLDDLADSQNYLRTALTLTPPEQRNALQKRIDTLAAELDRRAKNSARQPVVRDLIEQTQIVRARIAQ